MGNKRYKTIKRLQALETPNLLIAGSGEKQKHFTFTVKLKNIFGSGGRCGGDGDKKVEAGS